METLTFPDYRSANGTTPGPLLMVDYMLIVLADSERIPLLAVLCVVVVLSVAGNAATIVVNVRRPIRPMFRACLLSLAAGDLISTIFQSTSYVAQLASMYPPVWVLGRFMCGAIPFLTTWAVLVNSFALVAIALDRFVAVGKMRSLIADVWDPKRSLCWAGTAGLWALGAAIATPMIMRYEIVDALIIVTDPANRTQQIGTWSVQMCRSEKSPNLLYYAIVFGVIYAPMVLAFLWMNGTIAAEIWRRRRPIRSPSATSSTCSIVRPADDEPSSSKRTTETESNNGSSEAQWKVGKGSLPLPVYRSASAVRTRSSREMRQIRMFRAILAIMMVFMVCRVPSWAFLLYKLNNPANSPGHWLTQYALGILSLFSCVLNPVLYTFLAETIDASTSAWDAIRAFCGCRWPKEEDHGDRVRVGATEATNVAPITAPVVRPIEFYFSEDHKEKMAF